MIKVMLIEDDPMVRDINTKFVGKLSGFKVVYCTGNVEEAKEKIKELAPDLILLDIFLPKGNGLELLKWVRSKELCSDVILITADKSSGAVQEAFRYGAVDYLVKPFTFERFKEALTQFKKRYESINISDEVQQDTIDKFILNAAKESTIKEGHILTKGLSVRTYEQILTAAENRPGVFTADELAEGLGMARVTVRRYLDHMVKENKLQLEVEYGKIGRPTHFYKF
jgi:two-component system CitB family response regulator